MSDDPEKREKLGKEYNLKSYSYAQYSRALQDGLCDAFYIATPNNQHREFAVPALEQGWMMLLRLFIFFTEFIVRHRLSCSIGETNGSFSKRL